MRVRFTMRRMMIFVAVAAAALGAWVAIERRRNNPYRHEFTWCRDPSFRAEIFFESLPHPVHHDDPTCLLKIAEPGLPPGPQPGGLYRLPVVGRYALALDGQWREESIDNIGHKASGGYLERKELDLVRTLLAGLPPSGPISSKSEILIVHSFEDDRTRIYDKAALPAEVRRLLDALPRLCYPVPRDFPWRVSRP